MNVNSFRHKQMGQHVGISRARCAGVTVQYSTQRFFAVGEPANLLARKISATTYFRGGRSVSVVQRQETYSSLGASQFYRFLRK